MGLTITRGLLICGACGKRRGLGTHLCAPGKRRRRRTRLAAPRVAWVCSRCHKPRGVRHVCVVRSGAEFRKRKRAAERKRKTAERRRRRKASAAKRAERRKKAAAERRARDRERKKAAKTRTRPPRPKGDSHEPGTCGDINCPRYGCVAYFEGMFNCPRPHGTGEGS